MHISAVGTCCLTKSYISYIGGTQASIPPKPLPLLTCARVFGEDGTLPPAESATQQVPMVKSSGV